MTSRGNVLTHPIVLNEIANMAECSAGTAAVLLPWLVAVARFRPFVFRGLEAKALKGAVALETVTEVTEDLVIRWSATVDVGSAPALVY
jgi:hypothetical protein